MGALHRTPREHTLETGQDALPAKVLGLMVIAEEEELMLLPPCTVDDNTMDEAMGILAITARRRATR